LAKNNFYIRPEGAPLATPMLGADCPGWHHPGGLQPHERIHF